MLLMIGQRPDVMQRFLAVFGTIAVSLALPTTGAVTGRGPLTFSVRSTPTARTIAKVLSCIGLPELRPTNYVITCADANASWKMVRWSSWGGKDAVGRGYLYLNDCQPDCAAGHFHSYLSQVVLSEVRQTKHHGPLYSEGTFSYSVKGKHLSEEFGLDT
jgi:hypothetical protein